MGYSSWSRKEQDTVEVAQHVCTQTMTEKDSPWGHKEQDMTKATQHTLMDTITEKLW